MKKLSLIILSFSSVWGFSQTILNQAETTSRTVQDPQTVVLGQGFRAAGDISNPFVAKIGPATENPGGGPSNSNAGATNPTGTTSPPGQSFHNTKGNIDVTAAGQLQYNLPIALPPGVKDVAPSLNLAYLSNTGNGIAGYGWSVSGITTISRSGKIFEKDGETKGLQLDYSDYYSFNGQRLILKSGEYGKDGAEYVTDKYSNTRIRSIGSVTGQAWQGPAYWEITFEDGTQAWYGALSSGNNTGRTPTEYNIVKWKDKKGNYITYNYLQNNNIAIINTIQWGGNETLGKAHFNQVEFYYSPRNLQESSYIRGVPLIQDKILSTIVVKASGATYRSYSINYSIETVNNDPNNKVNYQFVKSVTEGNSVGDAANPVTFATKALTTGSSESGFGDYTDITTTGDYNGDGLVDFIVRQPAQNGRPEGYYIYFDAVNSTNPSFVYLGATSTYWPSSSMATVNIKPADNYIKPKQGLVIYKGNTGSNPPSTGNIELKFYSIKSDASVLNTFNNPLELEYSKTIPSNTYEFASSIYPPETDPDYMGGLNRSSLQSLKEVDIDSDGMSELIMAVADNKCKYRIIVPDPPKGTWMCKSLGYRYMVLDKDNIQNNTIQIIPDTTPKNILDKSGIMDFDNDGTQDVVFVDPTGGSTSVTFATKEYMNENAPATNRTFTTPLNNARQYELKKQNNGYTLNLKNTFTVKGLIDGMQFGDLNGDKNFEILLPLHENATNDIYTTGWAIYLNTGISLSESLQGLMYYRKPSMNPTLLTNYSKTGLIDLDNDGKTEILNSTIIFAPANNQLSTWFMDSYSEPYYNPASTDFKWRFVKKQLSYSQRPKVLVEPLFGDFRVNNTSSKILFLLKATDTSERKLISYQHYNLNIDKNISSITQAELQYDIEYKELDPVVNPNFYAPVKKEQYPYLEMEKLSQMYAVSQIKMMDRKQDFRYRGYIAHLQGRGLIGFRQTARSSWYADGFENTKIWAGTEIDPLNEGVPVKEWTIRTNSENLVFPADISENNTQLLSFKSTIYQTDRLVDGQLVSSLPSIDKSKVVTAIIPKSNKTKDFLTGTVTDRTVNYNNYYLPTQSISNVNSGYGITTTTYDYINNPSGIGVDYYIGRPTSKIDVVQAYGDTKSSKEEYSYENNFLKTLKTWNRDNTGWLQESYTYDGFGNIAEKTVSNNVDSQTQTTKSGYEPKGRFIDKKTDHLGLETNMTYNNDGQILTQTDPINNTIVKTYDNWGKLQTSKSNVSGTITYTYEKKTWTGDIWSGFEPPRYIVTEFLPDGDLNITYSNILGQNYKTTTKAFGQGQYLSKIYSYDILGRKIAESEPYFDTQTATIWNALTYDDSVFPTKITATSLASIDFSGAVISFSGKQVATTVSGFTTTTKEINGYGRTTTKTTDALGNTVSSTDAGGTVAFTYNAAGEQIKAQYAQNSVTTKYDAWGRKSEFNDPSNGLYKYEYDGFGQVKKITSPKGTKAYTYNNLGQLASQNEISTADGGQATNKTISYTYDNKGRIIEKSGTSKGKAYSSNIVYDPQGRIASTSENSNGKYFIKKGITYDDKEKVISYEKQLYSSGVLTKVQIEHVYNAWNGELSQIKDKNSGKVLWQLNETNVRGQVTSTKLGEVNITNDYDVTTGFLKGIKHASTVKPNLLQIKYQFDVIRNRLNQRTTEGDFSIIETFDYDNNNRLMKWTDPVSTTSHTNEYDVAGRIKDNDQVGKIKFENAAKSYQATSMNLNAEGTKNYKNDLIQRVVYNENNDPVFIDGEIGDVAFQYGLTNMRQIVTYGGNFDAENEGKFTKFYNEDGSFEIVKNNTTGQEKHVIYIGGTPYESNIVYLKNFTENNGSYKFLHKDYLGSILAISDEAGNKLEQRHFDAWGNFTHLQLGAGAIITDAKKIKSIVSSGDLLLERGYTSHEHFTEVGIVHMNGRLYDPLLRRFLNADEFIQDPYNTQSYNKYGYVLNNPLMYSDPNGEFFFVISFSAIIISALQAVVIGGLIYTGMAILTGNASKSGFLKSTLTSFITGAISGALGGAGIFGNGFWGTVAKGVAIGAAGGTVDAIVNQKNILQGLLKGAIIGGAVSAVSYSINYLLTPANENKITEKDLAEDTSSDSSTDSNTASNNNTSTNANGGSSELPYNDKTLSNMRQKNFGPEQMKKWGVNYDTVKSETYKQNAAGKFYDSSGEFVAYTDPKANFWNGRSTIYYSKSVFASPERLLKTMRHETVHAFGNTPGGMTFRLARKNIIRFGNDEWIDLEHLAIRKAEWSFLSANKVGSEGMNVLSQNMIELYYSRLDEAQRNIFKIMFNYINPMFAQKIVK
ncbi:RHS repeat-associated core domain-containing protein [Chryseobacterium lactis]|nr:RHS repeat-associated core domain-containing protein [Chryseobacterium lactis]